MYLQIEISPISVKCSDSGEYKCSISGNTGSINIDSESAPKTVGMRGKKKLLHLTIFNLKPDLNNFLPS
jgi:hypothetical protein